MAMPFEKPSLDMNKRPQAVSPRHLGEEEKSAPKNKAAVLIFFKRRKRLFLRLLFGVLILLAVFFVAKAIINRTGNNASGGGDWYSIKLVNGEVYFGQIKDISADPISADKVYYDYDQMKGGKGEETQSQPSNLRLVKRGNETHGPSGEMEIVRSQILFMEKLKSDSKVLKAILDYENGK